MEYVSNPMTGTVKYVTYNWSRWLKAYGWRDATYNDFMAWQAKQYDLVSTYVPPKTNGMYR